jgi:hypothetical protein
LLLSLGFYALPREASSQKVHEHVPERLQIVSPTLVNANVRVDASIPRSASQVFELFVLVVCLRFWVAVSLRQPEIDRMDYLRPLSEPDQEVVWLHIAVDEMFGVEILEPTKQLIGNHKNLG